MKDKCPICGGDLFENEYRDIQCVECRSIVPFNKPNWETIALVDDNFIVEYDKTRGIYRVSYFEDNHFVDDVIFDEYNKHNCPEGCPGTLGKYDF
jgi:hypothetical protein